MGTVTHRVRLFLIGVVLILTITITIVISGGMTANNIIDKIDKSQETHYEQLINKLNE